MVDGRHQVEVVIDLAAGTSDNLDRAYDRLKELKELREGLDDEIKKERKRSGRKFIEDEFGNVELTEFGQILNDLIVDDIDEAVKEATQPDDYTQNQFEEFVKNIDTGGLSNLQQLVANPAGFIQGVAFSGIGKAAQYIPILGLLISLISAPQVITAIIKKLSEPGGPFNRDWRRNFEGDIRSGIQRHLKRLSDKGLTTEAFAQQKGFLPNNVNWTYSNLYSVTEDRLRRAGMNDRAYGVSV